MTNPLTLAVDQLSGGADRLAGVEPVQIIEYIQANVGSVSGQRHPLGFLHIDLTSLLRGGTVVPRLHIWNHDFNIADGLGNAHDHVWHLCSVVLHGALTDTVLSPVPDDTGTHRPLLVHYGQAADDLVADHHQVRLDVVEQRHATAGVVYRLETGAVHETTITILPTATLVIATPTGNDTPHVYSSLDAEPGQIVVSVRTVVPRSQIAAELAALRSAMTP